jgi:hypothetical protein
MNDRKFAEGVCTRSLFEVTNMTTIKDTWYSPAGEPQSLGYDVYHMMVFRKRHEAPKGARRSLWEWHLTAVYPTRMRRLWCMLDMCSGCAGEAEGPLWMFAFHTREAARDYRKRLGTVRASRMSARNILRS